MCGISGYISIDKEIAVADYYRAHLKIAHRGPDDEGFIAGQNGSLSLYRGDDTIEAFNHLPHLLNLQKSRFIIGHRRLSIIDLTPTGHQPLNYQNYVLVFNGELYNYIELREELISEGMKFSTNADTEVFLAGYAQWGEEAFAKYNGMWSAVIYDRNKNETTFCRDRFGIKPLYYFIDNKSIYFGSEIRFLAPFRGALAANPDMIYDYIEYGYVNHTNETMFKEIRQLSPGAFARFSESGFIETKYWNLQSKTPQSVSPEEIRDTFFDAVKLRLRSDVEVGSLLSGGMDSTSIVCSVAQNKYAEHMQTFTITFPQKELDYERKYVLDVMEKTGFENIQVDLEPQLDLLDELIDIVELPFRSLTVLAIYNIYKLVKGKTGVTVLLNGEGSDEIFGGYNFHYSYFLLSLIKNMKVGQFFRELKYISKRTERSYGDLLYDVTKSFIRGTNLGKLISRDNFFRQSRPYYFPKYSSDPYENILMMNRDYSALPEYLLYGDKISMHFSLEVRVPFLDYRLVQLAAKTGKNQKVKDGRTKYILKEAMANVLPESVLNRKDKKGFFTPHDLWLKTILADSIEKEFNEIADTGLFDFINEKEVYKEYIKYRGEVLPVKLWRLFCLSRWKKLWQVAG